MLTDTHTFFFTPFSDHLRNSTALPLIINLSVKIGITFGSSYTTYYYMYENRVYYQTRPLHNSLPYCSINFHQLDEWRCTPPCTRVSQIMPDPFDDTVLLAACMEEGLHHLRVNTTGCSSTGHISTIWTRAGQTVSINATWLFGISTGLSPFEILIISGCTFARGISRVNQFVSVLRTNGCGAGVDGTFDDASVRSIQSVTRGSNDTEVYFLDLQTNGFPWIRVLGFRRKTVSTLHPLLPAGFSAAEFVHHERRLWLKSHSYFYYFDLSTEELKTYRSRADLDDGSTDRDGVFSKNSYSGISAYDGCLFISSTPDRLLRVFNFDSSSIFSLCLDSDRFLAGSVGECEMYTHRITAPYLSPQFHSLFFIAEQSVSGSNPFIARIQLTFSQESRCFL